MTQPYKTRQNCTHLLKTIHNFFTTLSNTNTKHNTQPYQTIHNHTQLYTDCSQLQRLYHTLLASITLNNTVQHLQIFLQHFYKQTTFTELYQTFQTFTGLYNSVIPHYKNITTLYISLQKLYKGYTQEYTTLQLYTTLLNSTDCKIYQTVLHNKLFTTIQIFTHLYTNLHNYTQLFKTLTNSAKTEHNFYKTLQNSTQFKQLYTPLQHFTQLYTTKHVTILYTHFTTLSQHF